MCFFGCWCWYKSYVLMPYWFDQLKDQRGFSCGSKTKSKKYHVALRGFLWFSFGVDVAFMVFSLCFPRPAGVYFTLLGSQGLRLLGHFYGCARTGETGWESATCYARKHRDGLLWAFTGENKGRPCAWLSMMVFATKGNSNTKVEKTKITNHIYK